MVGKGDAAAGFAKLRELGPLGLCAWYKNLWLCLTGPGRVGEEEEGGGGVFFLGRTEVWMELGVETRWAAIKSRLKEGG